MKKSKNIFLIAIVLVLLVALILAAIFFEKKGSSELVEGSGAAPTYEKNNPLSQTVEFEGKKYKFNEKLQTLLFMGIDDFGKVEASDVYTNDGHADFLMLAIMDTEKETYSLLHINRDTMTDVKILGLGGRAAGIAQMQIAVSHAYGSGLEDSCRNTVDAVAGLLGGVEADNYLSMTMDGVAALNDEMGGITLTVSDEFYNVPEFVKGEEITLTGDLALKYVRGRMQAADGTNINRMQRQRQYMELFIDALMFNMQDEDFAVRAFDKVSDYIVTDMSVDKISSLAERISSYDYLGVHTIEGEARLGDRYIEFYVDEELLEKQIIELFFVSA